MLNYKHPLLFLFLLLCAWQMALAQEPNPTTWPYGGIPDKTRLSSLWSDKSTLNFPHQANFQWEKFDSTADFTGAKFSRDAVFENAKFSQDANFYEAKFDSTANFRDVTFSQDAVFKNAKFSQDAVFENAMFSQDAVFENAMFSQDAEFIFAKFSQDADFYRAKFSQDADFYRAKFDSSAVFERAAFLQGAYFYETKFDSIAYFQNTTFSQGASFIDATFSQDANFSGAEFNGFFAYFINTTFSQGADFSGVTFQEMLYLEGCQFGTVLNWEYTNLEKGTDIRRAKFDSIKTIYVNHHTTFPIGKLYLYWEQFQAKDFLRIKLSFPSQFEMLGDTISTELYTISTELELVNYIIGQNEHYQRLETFYLRLRDNFLAQGDKASADAVMYELGWQKREIYGFWSWTGFWQSLYYWFFGYGYQPWRFLLFVVLPLIIIFAFVWYWLYYGILVRIINEKIDLDLIPNETRKVKFKVKEKTLLKSDKVLNQGIKLKIYDHAQMEKGLNRLSRYWHVLFFSTSVLLGIRFKKEWIKVNPPETVGQKSFIYVVTFEWLLGISLYVIFAILVKSNQFAYIKGLLGF